jgi:hypothetical protein
LVADGAAKLRTRGRCAARMHHEIEDLPSKLSAIRQSFDRCSR